MGALHVKAMGQGEPVLLIHGLGHRHQVWDAVADRVVSQGMQVIAVDLPGHGLSSKSWDPSGYSIGTTVARIVETMEDLGVQRPHVVGNSLGGLIALELAARGHGRSVTALAPAGFSPPLHLLKAGLVLLTTRINFARTPLGARPALDPVRREKEERADARMGFASRLRSLHSWAGFAGYLPHAFLARFRSELSVPATIAWGDRDAILDSSGVRRAARHISNVTWVEIANCGHFVMTDAPGEAAKLILETARRSTPWAG